jgi:PAS domain S-box-containing protein
MEAPVATAVYVGQDMVVQIANEAMIRLWGKDSTVIGKHLREALPELEGQPFHQLLDTVYTTGVAYRTEEGRADLVVDGKLQSFYFNFTYKPLRDAQGNVYAILNMAVDVTAHVQAKQSLKEAQERLHGAIELAKLGTWNLELPAEKVTLSLRIANWFGVSADEPTALDAIIACIHEKDRDGVAKAIQRALEPGSDGNYDAEYMVVNRQTGKERVVHAQGKVHFNENNEAYLLTGTAQDITNQKLIEQELERQVQVRTEELKKSNTRLQQSNQELERYAYVASHDLQEPLRKITMFSDLLLGYHKDQLSSSVQSYLRKIVDSADRMSGLIRDLLNFSRISSKDHQIEPIDLRTVVEHALKDFDVALTEKKGQVIFGELGVIEAIPLQIKQLFHNLISNSLKFARAEVPPVVTITSRLLPDTEVATHEQLRRGIPYREITVTDNGIGFDAAFSEKIFVIFQRLHTKQHYEGTGIGLALCQKIVTNHQGEISADAQENQGATFRIILPVKQQAAL